MSTAEEVETAEKAIKKRKATKNQIKPTDWLSTGNTLLNLACSDKRIGGFAKGLYYFFVGDSSSGKTFLTLTCFAEATRNPEFENYRLIYDNVENGALMNLSKYFGKKAARRIEAPAMKDGEEVSSETIEDFYYNIDDAIKDGRPFIYVLDSMDGLSSESEVKHFETLKKKKKKTATKDDEKTKGSYGDGKAKMNSQRLRRVVAALKKTGSILIIICQTRDNIGFDAMFNPKTRSGGKALKFYAALEIWTSIKGRIKKKIKERDRSIGIYVQCTVKKNRQSGKDRSVVIPLYHDYGLDDIGSNIDYLVQEKHWSGDKGKISATDYEVKMSRDKLIQYIEENNLEDDLRDIVETVWHEIEDQLKLDRKPKY